MPSIPADLVAHLRERAAARVSTTTETVTRDGLARIVEELIDQERRILPRGVRSVTVQRVLDEILGLGPLEPLLHDDSVTEIMVNGPARVYVERDGRIARTPVVFDDDAHLVHVIDRVLAPLGRRVDEASPMVDARLPDGSRVNAIIPPLSLDGPTLTIRRFGSRVLDGDELVRLGTLDARMLRLLRGAVVARRNILVTGGTGSGKTTTLAAIASFIPDDERIVTIEDAAELRLPIPHVVRLESRPPSIEGRGAIPIRALVRNALRMRPDRIVVGECRGGEAVDLLTAMTTGHEGSLSTVHASSCGDAIRRLQTLALMGDIELPYAAVTDQVAHAIDIVVHQARLADGNRRVMEIAAVTARGGEAEITSLVRRHVGPGEGDGHGHAGNVRWRDDAEDIVGIGDGGG